MRQKILPLLHDLRYLLSLRMRCRTRGEEQADSASSPTLGTVWGFQGVPRRTSGPDQHHFRWFQVTKLSIKKLTSITIFNLNSSAATVKKVILKLTRCMYLQFSKYRTTYILGRGLITHSFHNMLG
jgi:hypothetical protein